MNAEKENTDNGKIEVECWLKNNTEWYYPTKPVDLTRYDKIELLSKSYYGDLFYCYNEYDKHNGLLFRGKWNQGRL